MRANDRAKSAWPWVIAVGTFQSTAIGSTVLGKNGYPLKTSPRPIQGRTIRADKITAHTNCCFLPGVVRLSDQNFQAERVHPNDAKTMLEILNVMASDKSAMQISKNPSLAQVVADGVCPRSDG